MAHNPRMPCVLSNDFAFAKSSKGGLVHKCTIWISIALLGVMSIVWADMDWEHLTLRSSASEPKDAYTALQNEFYNLAYDETRTVGEYLQFQQDRKNRLQGMFLEYRHLTKSYLTDGTVEYVYHLPLKNLILTSLIPETRPVKLIVPMLCPCCEQDWPPGKPVPEGIELVPKQIEPIEYSGIIIDCRNVGFSPSLFPRVVDNTGNVIYSIDYAYKNAVIEDGLALYTTKSTVSIARAGNAPLRIQALGTRGDNKSDIIISTADALRIHGSRNNIDLLKECRIVIIADF